LNPPTGQAAFIFFFSPLMLVKQRISWLHQCWCPYFSDKRCVSPPTRFAGSPWLSFRVLGSAQCRSRMLSRFLSGYPRQRKLRQTARLSPTAMRTLDSPVRFPQPFLSNLRHSASVSALLWFFRPWTPAMFLHPKVLTQSPGSPFRAVRNGVYPPPL